MPITNIPVNDRRERYIASAGQTVFPYDFPIYAPTDLRVTRLRGAVETVLTYGADYAVTGADEQAGGNVTLTAGAVAGDVVVIESAMPVQRQAQFTNGGALPAAGLEAEFNRTLIAQQQFANLLSLTLRVPPTDPSVPSLPPVSARANRLLACDAAGNLIPAEGAAGQLPVTPFAATMLDDTGAAQVRATLGAGATGNALFLAATAAAAQDVILPQAWTDIASAATTDLGAVNAENLRVTGTTTITAFGTAPSGTRRQLRFAAPLTLTHNGTSLILPAAANITTAADDRAEAVSLGGGNWIVTSYTPATQVGGRALINAPAAPQAGGGVGQWQAIFAGSGVAAVLPSGGTWAAFILAFNSGTGVFGNAQVAPVSAGGTTIGTATVGIAWVGFCWRIA
jgi:hypothetical protein